MSELYQLPDGWEWKKLVELTEVNIKTPSRGKPEYFLGNNIWLSIRDLKDNYVSDSNEKITNEAIRDSNIKIVKKGTLLMSFKLTLGKTSFADCDLYTNEAIASLPIKNENLLDKYFLNYSIGVIDLEKEVDNAVKGKTLNKEKIKNLDIPVPPLVEQKRIVQKLDALFERIDKVIALLQKNIDAADKFMNSVLNDVFSDLEQRYILKSLENVSNIISGYAFKSNDFSMINEIKSIKITNVGVKCFIQNDENKLPFGLLSKLSKFTVNENDIVIALTRPYISNGLKVCFVPNSYDGAFINQRVAAIKSKDEITLNKYIYYYLCTSTVLSNVIELSKTLNQPNLSIKDLSEFELPLAPLSIQHKVVAYLDDLTAQSEQVKSAQQQRMQDLLDLKSSILDQAFHGKL